ncbi:MAG TPA: hypothetical protein VFK69_03175 [Candidatus Eisenbacteria bacterium]|nr:hypothetical protein [Candidatus Eisenbacteria bacterium]
MNATRLPRAAGVLLALLLGVAPACARSHHHHAPAIESAAPRQAAGGYGAQVGFRSEQRLHEHFRKHGRDVGAASPSDYLARAQALRDAAAGGEVLEQRRADGVITRFDRRTGCFVAFDDDGTIRTFFRPNQGETYFRRQAGRGDTP